MRASIFSLIFLLPCVLWGGCKNSGGEVNGVPGKLIIGSYAGDKPGQTSAALEPFRQYLQKKLGIEVAFFYTTDYTAVIEALRSHKIQMAYLTPFAYVIATRKPGLEPLVTLAVNGKPSLYHSIIFTSHATGIRSMADVKARSKNLTLCFADPASTSGHLIPRAYLNSIGLNPDSAFKAAIFAGSHAAAILSVKSGKVDVGCSTSELALDKLIREGMVNKNEMVILWTSPPIVNDAITIRNDLSKDFIKKVQNAFIDANKDDFQSFSQYVRLYYPHPENMAYVAVHDSMYNGLRKIAANTKDLKLK